jgi:hypothetical protein
LARALNTQSGNSSNKSDVDLDGRRQRINRYVMVTILLKQMIIDIFICLIAHALIYLSPYQIVVSKQTERVSRIRLDTRQMDRREHRKAG